MKKKLSFSSFDWILFGLILHSLGGSFFYTSKITCYVLCGTGLAIISINAIFKSKAEKPFTGFISIMFYLYLAWSLFILLRPFFSDERFTTDGYSLINRYTWLSLTTPLIVFLGFRNISIKSIFNFCFIQGIIGVFLIAIHYHEIFVVNHNFDLDPDGDVYQAYLVLIDLPLQFLSVTSFLLLCYAYISSKQLIAAWMTMCLSLYTVLFTARRGNVFMYLLMVFFTFFLYVSAPASKASKLLKLIFVAVLLLVGFGVFELYSGSAFSFFISRLGEDTRSGVEALFMQSFKGKPLDWMFGRGINGTYSSSDTVVNSNRGIIETGYLQLILNGGIVYLTLFVGFLGQSAFLGFFRTKNMLTKGMALYLIAHIVYLAPYGLPEFNVEYVIVWICVFCCQSEKFRTSTDAVMKMYVNFT